MHIYAKMENGKMMTVTAKLEAHHPSTADIVTSLNLSI